MFRTILLIIHITNSYRWCLQDQDFNKSLSSEIAYFESYTFQSLDGYYIKVFRIRNSKDQIPVVVLNHSLELSSNQFIDNPKGNLATELVLNGYDVWLINQRGSAYSCFDKQGKNDFDYFNFSFQEMGLNDFPVVIDKIYELTKQKLNLIGHSQGSAFYLTGIVEHPDKQTKINKVITLAQATSMQDFENNNPIMYSLLPFFKLYLSFQEKLGYNEFLPFKLVKNKMIFFLTKIFCNQKFNFFCKMALYILAEKHPQVLNWDDFSNILYQFINPRSSIKSLRHYMQQLNRDDIYLRKYDYGKEQNKKIYNQEEPPIYDFSKINIPVLIYIGEGDQLSTIQDNLDLKEQLLIGYLRRFQKVGHLYWLLGDKPHLFINQVLQDLKDDYFVDIYIKYEQIISIKIQNQLDKNSFKYERS